jgi:hypothetical protein
MRRLLFDGRLLWKRCLPKTIVVLRIIAAFCVA